MKKKALIIFLSIFGLMFALVAYFGTARPTYSGDHSSCHPSGVYTISSNVSTTVEVNGTTTIIINITATGTNLFVQIVPGAKNNDDFVINPTTARITDGSPGIDLDANPDAITVIFNVTTPADEDYYYLFIIAGDDVPGKLNFAFIEIDVSVGGVAAPKANLFDYIFDHLGLYLGMPALILLTLGTILVIINESKFVKIHGILAGGSWILTAINVSAALIKIPLQEWSGYELIYHLPHIVLGAIGLVTGFVSMLFGIAAERKPARLTGYITLICWWAAFFTGYLLNSDLLLLKTL